MRSTSNTRIYIGRRSARLDAERAALESADMKDDQPTIRDVMVRLADLAKGQELIATAVGRIDGNVQLLNRRVGTLESDVGSLISVVGTLKADVSIVKRDFATKSDVRRVENRLDVI